MTSSNRKPTTSTTVSEPTPSRTVGIAVAVLIALVVAAIVASLALGGAGEEAANNPAAEAARIPTSGTVREVSSTQTGGTPLPKFDSSQVLDPAVGQPAPTITASHFDNTEVTIDFADGQPRVVLFFAHWCPHCQDEVQSLVSRFERDGIRDDVEIVTISTSVDAGAPNYPPSRWLISEQWPTPALRDSTDNDLASAFGLSGFPFMVLIDGDGKVVARQSGAAPETQWNPMLDRAVAN